uniref:Putative secreted peptide n=1 Tax=Anopheles braziliensis TaxID=58242 RepID=A0A2M3ZSG0_9DIPT
MCPIVGHLAIVLLVVVLTIRVGRVHARRYTIVITLCPCQRGLVASLDRLVFGTVFRNRFGALLMVRVATIHTPQSIQQWTPQDIATMVTVDRGRVDVLLKAMRMQEVLLMVTSLPSAHQDLQRGTFVQQSSMRAHQCTAERGMPRKGIGMW